MPPTKRKAKKPPGRKKKEGKLVEPKRKMNISEKERKRRSDAAKRKHEEGKLGGAEFGKLGGRPRKKRATEVMAEGISEMGEEMLGVLKDAMDEENPHSIRLKAVEAATKIEEKEARLAMDEEDHLRKMGHEELVAAVAAKFATNPMVLAIFRQAGEADPAPTPPPAIEGSAEDITDAEVVA